VTGAGLQRPKKRFGQHFLADRSVVRSILEASGLGPSDRVLEIGPGRGALTFPLAARGTRILAVEKDRDLAAWLETELGERGLDNVTLLCEDILRFDFGSLERFSPGGVQVLGNLPYNISTPVLERLIQNRRKILRAVLMFQKEVADRLTASPGGRTYGALTVLVGVHARTRRILRVDRNAFRPRPQVGSAVVELDFGSPHPARPGDEAWFRRVVRGAFGQRRKTLQNALAAFVPELGREGVGRALDRCGIDPRRRAETLGVEDYTRLAEALAALLPAPDPDP
jgi:16S rRNA (adenine1518-N6/adenine1519-N6)-dimethyltransferase